MIVFRFPPGMQTAADALPHGPGISVTSDPKIIALEGEKNGATVSAEVDRVLRPHFQDLWSKGQPLFHTISIETRSGCNYECSFCPVARSVDPRPPGELRIAVLTKLLNELSELRFAGRICLFGNNEPLLDDRLVSIVGLARRGCPHADIRILSNGTQASPDRVVALFEAGLSSLVINNYTNGRRIIGPVRRLAEAANELLPYDIRVSVRDRREVLTTRAGLAPNKPSPTSPPRGFCALPFTDLHISYTGNVNLCCFDAHGRVTMGTVGDSSIVDIWRSASFARHRDSLLASVRTGLSLCGACDFDGFRQPHANADSPLTREDLGTGLGGTG